MQCHDSVSWILNFNCIFTKKPTNENSNCQSITNSQWRRNDYFAGNVLTIMICVLIKIDCYCGLAWRFNAVMNMENQFQEGKNINVNTKLFFRQI